MLQRGARIYHMATRLLASTRATCTAARPVPSLIWWRQEVPSATTMVEVARLIDPAAWIEIEADAIVSERESV